MKIAILGVKGVPGHHGVEVVVDSLLPHLVELGHDITVYGYSSYTADNDDYQGVRVRTVEGSANKNFEMISHMWKAVRAANAEGFDIAHIHSADPCLLAGFVRTRYGIIATSHGQAYVRKKWSFPARKMSRLAESFFIRVPDVRTSVSKPLADYYNDRYHANVVHIPNGIKMREKPDAAHLDKWDLKPGGYLFCSAGRIERTKGLSTLVEAYGRLDTDIPLVIAGGGAATDYEYFEELKASSPEGVRYVGFLKGDEYYALFAHASIFVFPSEYEAMSMALLEGLSFGTPTVYSDIPENEAVASGIGYPFRVSDSSDLEDRLRHVLLNPREAGETGMRAVEFVRKNHGWDAVARWYHELYMKMAERKA
ncbi:MAG TPA: glycosyltransferase family 4 protein [Candidatus Krumholzibacterium sp.]|nr:glycosyltransferase family 4 protein [Candidatus Krumholzibacterium sp.]